MYLESPLLHLNIVFSCWTCILLLRKTEWTRPPQSPPRLWVSAACFRHWIFMLILLYKHFHIWTETLGFVGRSKLKQKGRKNTMLCSVCRMEKPYWTVITKMDVYHSTEGYVQTIIKTLPVQCKGQYKDQCLAVTTANYSQ